jgi:hypothetical protein
MDWNTTERRQAWSVALQRMKRCINLFVFVTATLFGLTCAILIAGFLYLSRDTCEDASPSPVVRNSRGDMAEGQVQICSWVGTVVNSYITLELHQPTRI